MFKFIRRLILTILVLLMLVVGVFVWMGYKDYKEVTASRPLQGMVIDFRTQKDYVSYDDISPYYFDALIAIEDKRFESHGGIDYIALIRTTIANVMAKELLGGGSTITQQLAKNFYFMQSNKITRKISEAFVAYELEHHYSKEDIIEMYANIVYFGDNYYGIYDASMGYYGVTPDKLTLSQASMLAGLPQAPSVYALSNNNPASYKRQEEVLKAMLEENKITTDEFIEALREK